MTIVTSSSVAGALMITFLAPPTRCFFACSPFVKIPVDSITISAPTEDHGKAAGSRSAKTLIVLPSTVIESSVWETLLPKGPSIESYLRRWARVAVSVRSLIATISTLSAVLCAAKTARKKFRPIRPNPFTPTLIIFPSLRQ